MECKDRFHDTLTYSCGIRGESNTTRKVYYILKLLHSQLPTLRSILSKTKVIETTCDMTFNGIGRPVKPTYSSCQRLSNYFAARIWQVF